ncbi:MAG: biopolymer transporter ExbD [candidate division KSB1 bacterium]|nr:biopolymer transporter ExbD [candidate division KSB1 bacterium]
MRRRDTDLRRVELTPLIDCIFLLLIFFLVSLNILPGGGLFRREGAYANEALTRDGSAAGYAVVALKWLHAGGGQWQTYYVGFPSCAGSLMAAVWNTVRTASAIADLQGLSANRQFRLYHGPHAEDIREALTGASSVLIIAGPDNGHEFTFGEVHDVVELCRESGSAVAQWFLSPESADAYRIPDRFSVVYLPPVVVCDP